VFEDLNLARFNYEIVEWFRFNQSRRAAIEPRDGLGFSLYDASRPAVWRSARFPQLNASSRPWCDRVRKNISASSSRCASNRILAGAFWGTWSMLLDWSLSDAVLAHTANINLSIHPSGHLGDEQRGSEIDAGTNRHSHVPGFDLQIGYSHDHAKSYRLARGDISYLSHRHYDHAFHSVDLFAIFPRRSRFSYSDSHSAQGPMPIGFWLALIAGPTLFI